MCNVTGMKKMIIRSVFESFLITSLEIFVSPFM